MGSGVEAFRAEVAGASAHVTVGTPLARLTTLRVGGPAAAVVTVDDEAALQRTVVAAHTHGLPLLVVGRGSNLLVGDEGWPGVVLRLGEGFRGLRVAGTTVRAGAAEPMPSVAVTTARAGLGGFAWGAAVPGSMGGGVRMNAGAHGADMADTMVTATVLDVRTGELTDWGPDRLALGYRTSALDAAHVVTAVTLTLTPADAGEVLAEIDRIRTWRRTHQPLERPSCGSVFTNPPGTSAGALIEEAGLKGQRIGGAEVSTRHANFIVTDTDARAADVAALIDHVVRTVAERTGTVLRPEVVRPDVADPTR